MKRLIIVRHGHYHSDEFIGLVGQHEMKGMGNFINKLSVDQKNKILSSVAKRARQSATILSKVISAKVECHEVLWTEWNRPPNIKAINSLIIENQGVDNLVLLTHSEVMEDLPSAFGKEVLGVDNFPAEEIEKGGAWIIDCEQKTIDKVQARCS